MHESDIPEVLEIERMSFTTPWSEAVFYNEIYRPFSITRVAFAGEKLVGYICANQIIDEGHILNLAVHPDYRRRSIASTLVEGILKELKDCECRVLYLEVRISNHAARKLYEGFGFKVVGIRKCYYVSPIEDAVIMMLEM
ncbi:MAG: ribosomal protein S18-alanine N-acetyltransferase [Nitrospirae bacterium]|nr:ribosomal protein S18-alanine N-acetyltransferase [Nitrospirota bacterium]